MGFDNIRRHLPDINNLVDVLYFFLPSILLWILLTLFSTAVVFTWSIWQFILEILLIGLGFGLLALFFRYKVEFKDHFGALAYSKAASWLGLPAAFVIGYALFRLHTLPAMLLPQYLAAIVFPVLGWMLIGFGVLLGLRTVQIFGVDNLTMLYIYFPEESHLVRHKIYTIVRHPAYSALQCLAYGLALLSRGWMAPACAFIFSMGLWTWLRLVEEKELIKRFGPSYEEYRKQVPPFLPRPHDFIGLFEFIVSGR